MNKETQTSPWATLAITGIVLSTIFYWGWVLMTLWGWFAVTASGLSPLPYAFWVGICLIIGQLHTSVLTYDMVEGAKDKTGSDLLKHTGLKIATSLMALGVAWVVFKVLL